MSGHASDCAVHNAPAYAPGPCDCGVDAGIAERIAKALHARIEQNSLDRDAINFAELAEIALSVVRAAEAQA